MPAKVLDSQKPHLGAFDWIFILVHNPAVNRGERKQPDDNALDVGSILNLNRRLQRAAAGIIKEALPFRCNLISAFINALEYKVRVTISARRAYIIAFFHVAEVDSGARQKLSIGGTHDGAFNGALGERRTRQRCDN